MHVLVFVLCFFFPRPPPLSAFFFIQFFWETWNILFFHISRCSLFSLFPPQQKGSKGSYIMGVVPGLDQSTPHICHWPDHHVRKQEAVVQRKADSKNNLHCFRFFFFLSVFAKWAFLSLSEDNFKKINFKI